jgi:hypothetical protein
MRNIEATSNFTVKLVEQYRYDADNHRTKTKDANCFGTILKEVKDESRNFL